MSDPRCQKQEQESGGEQGDDLDLAAYALGALDPEARARLEARLRADADQGLSCRLAEYRAVTALLPHAVPQALPPGAWGAVLSRVREDRRARGAPAWRTPFAPFRPSRRVASRLGPAPARGKLVGGPGRAPAAGALAPGATAVAPPAVERDPAAPATRPPLHSRCPGGRRGQRRRGTAAGPGSRTGLSSPWKAPDGRAPAPGSSSTARGAGPGWRWPGCAPPRERVYQLWFARPGEPTVSGATFRVDAEGGAVTPVRSPPPSVR